MLRGRGCEARDWSKALRVPSLRYSRRMWGTKAGSAQCLFSMVFLAGFASLYGGLINSQHTEQLSIFYFSSGCFGSYAAIKSGGTEYKYHNIIETSGIAEGKELCTEGQHVAWFSEDHLGRPGPLGMETRAF